MGSGPSYFFRVLLLSTDFLLFNLSYFAGGLIAFDAGFPVFHYLTAANILIFNVSWLICASLFRLYRPSHSNPLEEIYRSTIKALLLHFIVVTAVILFYFPYQSSLKTIFLEYGILGFAFTISRLMLTYMIDFISTTINFKKKIAIVGYNERAKELAHYFREHKSFYSFEGFFDEGTNFTVNDEGDIVSPIKNMIPFAVQNNVREIYSTILPDDLWASNKHIIEKASSHFVRVKFVPQPGKKLSATLHHTGYIKNMPVLSLRAEPLQHYRNRVKKRIFDIVISSVVVICILSWLTPLLGIIIKFQSKGPVFFKQLRSGKDNVSFWCYKFRSMYENKHADELQASKNDDRVTPIGRFIRRTSIDEFPQFFNVLLGNMSLVGPRPHMLQHTREYSAIIDEYMIRHFSKPGITGWAQVNGCRGETETKELMVARVEYDLWYMENWSLMLDLRIVFRTIINLLKRDENAF
jgi:putative colanic acid biosysnthesis UDP-glucose lipid carrier transferase